MLRRSSFVVLEKPQTSFARMRKTSLVGIAVAAALLSCESFTDLVARDTFDSDLNGAKVRPTAVQTNGQGHFDVLLTSDSTNLRYHLTFTGLSSAATAAHIHGPAGDTATAAILVNFAALPTGGVGTIELGTTGSATGSFDLSLPITLGVPGPEFFQLLHAGRLYVDVHTVTNPDGEIRGQVGQ